MEHFSASLRLCGERSADRRRAAILGRMAKTSAGLLMYRDRAGGRQVLLVHPGGPFWAKKDAGVWTIPKGEVEPGEDGLATARREFAEETGSAAAGPFAPLGTVKQAGGKTVHAWAFAGDLDTTAVVSSTFEMEWPPRSGKRATFPEVDRAEWFDLTTAAEKINPAQRPFLEAVREVTPGLRPK